MLLQHNKEIAAAETEVRVLEAVSEISDSDLEKPSIDLPDEDTSARTKHYVEQLQLSTHAPQGQTPQEMITSIHNVDRNLNAFTLPQHPFAHLQTPKTHINTDNRLELSESVSGFGHMPNTSQLQATLQPQQVLPLATRESQTNHVPPNIELPVPNSQQNVRMQGFVPYGMPNQCSLPDPRLNGAAHMFLPRGAFFGPIRSQDFNNNLAMDLSQFLLKKELLVSRLTTFNDRPESYTIWKASFRSIMSELRVTVIEELDLMVKYLGPESSSHAVSLRAAYVQDPGRDLERLWERLDER